MQPGARVPVVLVLGGAGFIGRHAVAALQQRDCSILVGSRHAAPGARDGAALRCHPWRQARLEQLQDPADWLPLLDGVDVVLNCVGILRQRGRASYARVHHGALQALAVAAAGRGLRLVHVSALGLDSAAGSAFIHSKQAGERALAAAGGDWRLVRPSLLDAEHDGFGARWLRRLARWPLHCLPDSARGRIAALDVRDLGAALARLALDPPAVVDGDPGSRIYELGGPDARDLAGHLAALRALHGLPPARVLRLPHWLARLASHCCDLLHFSPFSYGHLELLRHDNRPRHNRLAELLGRPPRPVGATPDCTGAPAPAPAR